VNQGGRFQRLPGFLLCQTPGGQSAQLVVHERQQLSIRVRVAGLDIFADPATSRSSTLRSHSPLDSDGCPVEAPQDIFD
jgi:hypothetical protein